MCVLCVLALFFLSRFDTEIFFAFFVVSFFGKKKTRDLVFFGVQEKSTNVSFFCRHRKREPPPLRYIFLNPLLLLLPFEFSNSRYKKDTVLFAQHQSRAKVRFRSRLSFLSSSSFCCCCCFSLWVVSRRNSVGVSNSRAHELEHLDLNSPPVLNWSRERIGQ